MATRYSQPQSGPFIPSAYWLSRGLQLVFDGRRVVWSRRATAGINSTTNGTPKAVAVPKGIATGIGATYGTGTTDRVDSGVLTSPTTGFRSVVAAVYANGQGGGSLGRVFQSTSGAGNANAGDEGIWLAAGLMSFTRVTSGLTGAQYSLTGAFPTGRWATFGYSFLGDYPTNTAPALYLDGVPGSVTTNQAATSAFSSSTSINIGWGNRASDSARSWDGMLGPVLIFDGYLTPQEHAQLAANPWQVFQPSNRTIFVPAASSGPTGTGSNTVDAFTSAGNGTVAISGTGSNTTAAFASAGTGTIPITGTGANTLADFTQSASGTVANSGINGTGANTVSNFTSAATGQVPISGTGSSTATQTSNGAGTVAISGTGSNTLAGFTSSGSGNVQAGSYSITAARANLIYEMALLHGLDPAKPLSVSPTSRSAGSLLQTVDGTSTVTITTQASEILSGNLDDWIDKLAAIHGLTVPLVVTASGRTAGTTVQSFAAIGPTTTVTTA